MHIMPQKCNCSRVNMNCEFPLGGCQYHEAGLKKSSFLFCMITICNMFFFLKKIPLNRPVGGPWGRAYVLKVCVWGWVWVCGSDNNRWSHIQLADITNPSQIKNWIETNFSRFAKWYGCSMIALWTRVWGHPPLETGGGGHHTPPRRDPHRRR